MLSLIEHRREDFFRRNLTPNTQIVLDRCQFFVYNIHQEIKVKGKNMSNVVQFKNKKTKTKEVLDYLIAELNILYLQLYEKSADMDEIEEEAMQIEDRYQQILEIHAADVGVENVELEYLEYAIDEGLSHTQFELFPLGEDI